MNVYIITDLEGISGIDNISQVNDTESVNYRYSLERLMADTNAAIAGAFDGGAKKVYVCDGHGGGNNFIKELLDPRAVQSRLSVTEVDFSTIDAFMHVGAHAMSGTQNAFLDHTQSSVTWHNYIVNGKRSGELAQSGIFAGAYGVSYVMVSGDEAACVESKQFFGDIKTAVVKYAVGRNNARSINLYEAVDKIRTAAREGMELVGKIKPYKPLLPLEVKVEFNRADYCDDAALREGTERLDARTVRRIVTSIENYGDVLI